MTFSHAVLLDEDEAEALLGGLTDHLLRGGSTGLRMRVGLMRSDGTVVATANLIGAVDASDRVDGRPASAWMFGEVEPLARPLALPPGGGPLWRRLSGAERAFATGEAPKSLASAERLASPGDENPRWRNATPIPSPAEALSISMPLGRTMPADAQSDASPAPSDAGRDDGGLAETSEGVGLAEGPVPHEPRQLRPDPRSSEPENGGASDLVAGDADGGPCAAPSGADASSEEAARARALAFVPSRMIDVDEAYRLLVRLRDAEIKRTFPDVRPEHGILRRTMLQAMLDSGVASREDYDELVLPEMRNMTDPRQLQTYLDPILRILAHVT